ncbi:MAG: Y-family DNA polymerase [Muribaculaceae bacterium]|nr:Y-family DNA polymerase [Muribaculaceae bacterium]
MTGLADCNNFFVSCERSVNPALEGRAVVVLSNNDGCIVARSNEAKRMGIRMGQPAFEVRYLVESGRLIALSGNHLLYRDISLRVHDIFRRFVPSTIDYSVDESFLDVSGIPCEYLLRIGGAIHATCQKEMRIPVTIGFAPTKTLAKVVTEQAKKQGLPTAMVRSAEEALPLLRRNSISDLWGIGRRLAKRLYSDGIYTMADFAGRDRFWVRRKLGVTGERSWLELNGFPCIGLEHVGRTLQDSISETRTFPEDVDDYDYLRARVVIYASDCAKKLRAMNGLCRSVGVFLRTNPFRQSPVLCRPEGIHRLDQPTSVTTHITAAALSVLDRIYVSGIPFKRGGVWLTDITPDVPVTPSLFEAADIRDAALNRFMKTVDRINGEVGGARIGLASQMVKAQRGHNDGYSSSFQAPRRYPQKEK